MVAYGFPPGHEGGSTGWKQWITGPEQPAAQSGGALAYTGKALPAGYGLMDFNFKFLSLDTDDPAYDWRKFDADRDLPRMRTMTEILSPADPDLRPFMTRTHRRWCSCTRDWDRSSCGAAFRPCCAPGPACAGSRSIARDTADRAPGRRPRARVT